MVSRHRTRLWLQALEERRTPATFIVDNTNDGGFGSLRQAIEDSNAAAGADTIVFDASFSTAKAISLLSALPNIADDLTITGPGSKLLTVTRDPSVDVFRIFTVKNLSATLTVSISGMKITNGYNNALTQTDNGGGIYVGGNHSLTLDSVEISGNTSTAQGGGIAMDLSSHLTMTNSTVSGNVALGISFGSPLEPSFSGVGGGIYFTLDGSLTILNSTIDNNTAAVSGGGIFLYGESSGTAIIRNTTISSNTVTSTHSGFLYKSGGGGIAVLNNSFGGGSGLFALTLQNSTVTSNTAFDSQGGGIQLSGLQANKITARIESSLVAGNTAGSGIDIFGGSGFSAQKVTVDYSAIGSTTGFTLTAGPGGAASNQTNKAFPLGPLDYNPSTALTRTHLPPAGSSLIDKGSNPGAASMDQRGLTRYYDDPAVSGTLTVDIGAVEVQPAGVPTASATSPIVTTPGGTSQTITVVYQDDTGITTGTIGTGDILVTGPGGYSKTGTLLGTSGSGTSVTATYTVPAAGAAWSGAASGLYTISMAVGQVTDGSGNSVPAGAIGTFMVAIPRTIVVTTANDNINPSDGKTSLREAIILANETYPSNDTITFDPSVFQGGDFITWSLGQMFITDSVTIVGTGPTKLTFDGGSVSRHFNIDGPGVLNVTITGVTMSSGRTSKALQSERGGSIYNNGENLTLDNVWMLSNSSQQSYGGAIHIQGQGTVTFNNGRLNNNSAPNFAGGAISALDTGHVIAISNSRMIGNVGGYYGGAIFSSGGGSVTIDRTTVSNNTTTLVLADDQGGSIITGGGGAVMVANGKVVDGSVLVDYPSVSSLIVQDSLFDSNTTAASGGAIQFNGNTTGVFLRNSTFVNNKTGNSQNNVGGALLVGNLQGNPVLIDNCTFAMNFAFSGGALFVENDNLVSVKATSTIFAQNSSADPTQLPPDVDGFLTANNCFFGVVEGVGLESGSANNLGNGSLMFPADPMFDFLQDNGGPTWTLGLLPGSPCLDTGSNPNDLIYDQRGVGYARVSGGSPDIGAFELQVATAPPPTVTDVTFGDGSGQRSMVKQIVVMFSEPVTFSPDVVSAFTLTRTGTGGATGNVDLIVDPPAGPTNMVTLTFFGSFTQNGSLIDGFYDFTISAGVVSGAGGALDGNYDTIPGGSYSVTGDTANKFFRLFGDADGDSTVTLTDYIAFRGVFNLGPSDIFDFGEGDNNVGIQDYIEFRSRFNFTP